MGLEAIIANIDAKREERFSVNITETIR